jgi:EAL domain-containing protein (putative c-di-GMP-specific phosphodiesterase class I)
MGIKAYAVGVESAEQAKKLKDMGVDALQGYYYGKPEEAEAFEKEHLS